MTDENPPIFCGMCGRKTWQNKRCWNPSCGYEIPNLNPVLTERTTTSEQHDDRRRSVYYDLDSVFD